MELLRDYIDDLVGSGNGNLIVSVVYEDGIHRELGQAQDPDIYDKVPGSWDAVILNGFYPMLGYGDNISVDVYVEGLCQDEAILVRELLDSVANSSKPLSDYMIHLTSQSDGSTVFGSVDDWRFTPYDDYIVLSHYIASADESNLGVDTVTVICE